MSALSGGSEVSPIKLERAKELRRRMTTEDSLLWQQLRRNLVHGYHFRRQHVFAGFILDFYCHEARLVVEVDGPIHLDQPEYDAERDAILSGHNLRVLRITNEEVHRDMQKVLSRISAACAAGEPT